MYDLLKRKWIVLKYKISRKKTNIDDQNLDNKY